MYERSRHLLDCHIAGFAFYDGLDVVNDLSLGARLNLKPEPDNPYDPNAVAVYFEGVKLGYIPKAKNDPLSTLLYFGNGNIVEARISYLNLKANPEGQCRLALRMVDNRKTQAGR